LVGRHETEKAKVARPTRKCKSQYLAGFHPQIDSQPGPFGVLHESTLIREFESPNRLSTGFFRVVLWPTTPALTASRAIVRSQLRLLNVGTKHTDGGVATQLAIRIASTNVWPIIRFGVIAVIRHIRESVQAVEFFRGDNGLVSRR
jgi:hypothetical protein